MNSANWTFNKDVYLGPRDRYFWVKAKDFIQEKKVAAFKANIEKNKISINIDEGIIKTLRLYLSQNMLDLDKEINVEINGNLIHSDFVQRNKDMSKEIENDSGYLFDTYIDINL